MSNNLLGVLPALAGATVSGARVWLECKLLDEFTVSLNMPPFLRSLPNHSILLRLHCFRATHRVMGTPSELSLLQNLSGGTDSCG
jgi:hypothetical protein